MPHANDVVAHLNSEQLVHLLRQRKVKVEEGKKKSHYVDLAREEIDQQGVKELLNLLKQSELLEIAEPLIANQKIDVEGANKNNKPVLAKRLKDLALENGLDTFFNDDLNVDQLKNVLDTLGEDNSSSNHDTLARNAAEATRKAGLSILLSSLPVPVLQDIAAEGKSKVDSSSSGVLIEAIVTGRAPERRAPPKPESKFSKSKQDIKKGITYQDIFQHYNKDELEEYARKEGLKVSGKKPDLIKRILKYLDGDEESTKVQKRKADSDASAEKKGKKARKSSPKKPKAEKPEKPPKSPKSPSKNKKSKKSSDAPEEGAEAAESK